MKKSLIIITVLFSLMLPSITLAEDDTETNDEAVKSELQSSESLSDCKDICRANYEGADRRACRRTCRDIFNSSDPNDESLSGEALIDALVPSNEDLFGEDAEVGLATGDLEQGLAPRALGIIVSFSGVIALVVFTYLGIRLALARSNEDEMTKVKRAITNTFIAAVVIAGSFAVIIGILRIFDAL